MNFKPTMTLQQFNKAKIIAFKEHANNFKCDHKNTDTRKLRVQGGAWQLVHQCLDCGERASSNALSQSAVNMADVPEFDQELLNSNRENKNRAAKNIEDRFDRNKWFESYDKYLGSDDWKDKRRLVMERAGNVCEGCRKRQAIEIHHITYDHAGNEFLFELVAVCEECHERLHTSEDDA